MGAFSGARGPLPLDGQGRVIVAVDSVPAGGASEAKQDEIIAALATVIANTTGLATEITLAAVQAAVEAGNTTLASILTALGSLATSVDVAAVEAAIVALGGGSTLADIEAALAPLAKEATQLAVKAELEAQGVTLDLISSTLTTIESNTDDLETIAAAARDRLPPVIGPRPVDESLSVTGPGTARQPNGTTIPIGTSFLISAVPGQLKRLVVTRGAAPTKYVTIHDSASIPPTTSSWTKEYLNASSASGETWLEWPDGLKCAAGCALGVSAARPIGGALTLSTAVAEKFYLIAFTFEPES